MKNATKAVIAGVAGIALLTGGAGSLAYWNDTQTGSSVSIQAGTLTLGAPNETAGWILQQNASDVPTSSTTTTPYVAGTTLMVPGDTLSTTVTLPVTLTGTDNKATLSVTAPVPASPLTVAVTSVNGTAGSSATISPAAGVQNIQVKVVITFPWGSTTTPDNTSKGLSTTYQLSYTLTQVPRG